MHVASRGKKKKKKNSKANKNPDSVRDPRKEGRPVDTLMLS